MDFKWNGNLACVQYLSSNVPISLKKSLHVMFFALDSQKHCERVTCHSRQGNGFTKSRHIEDNENDAMKYDREDFKALLLLRCCLVSEIFFSNRKEKLRIELLKVVELNLKSYLLHRLFSSIFHLLLLSSLVYKL